MKTNAGICLLAGRSSFSWLRGLCILIWRGIRSSLWRRLNFRGRIGAGKKLGR